MGSNGDAYDCDYNGAALRRPLTLHTINVLVESMIGLLKTGVIQRAGQWMGSDRVELATLKCGSGYSTITVSYHRSAILPRGVLSAVCSGSGRTSRG